MAVALSMTVIQVRETHADMQRALDSALLSTARYIGKNHANPSAPAQAYLQSYVDSARIPARRINLQAAYSEDRSKLVGDLSFDMDGLFAAPLRMAGDGYRRKLESEVSLPARKRVEIAFALDMSGSMVNAMPGEGRTRMDSLQIAFNDLLDLVEEEKRKQEETRLRPDQVLISVTPYAASVNIGHLESAVASPLVSTRLDERTKAGAVMSPPLLTPPASHGPEPHAFFKAPPARTWDEALMAYYSLVYLPKAAGDTQHEKEYWRIIPTRTTDHQNHSPQMLLAPYLWRGAWAAERQPAYRGADAAPEGSGKPPFVSALGAASLYNSIYTPYREELHKEMATPILPVLPLTDDLDNLRAYAKHFVSYGGTGGHLGMEWAWHTISPNWAGVWAVRQTNQDGVFQRVTSIAPQSRMRPVLDMLKADPEGVASKTVDQLILETGGPAMTTTQQYVAGDKLPAPYGMPDLQKIIVLMTDGQFSRPVDPGAGMTAAQSYAYFQSICDGARKAGVTIYTIAFTEDAKDHLPLQNCAGRAANFSVVNNTQDLTQAFRRVLSNTSLMHVSR